MSYAGPARTRASTSATSARPTSARSVPTPARRGANHAVSAPADETDWQHVAIFGVGVALGIAVGAGAALLAAPHSGAETRAILRARAGRVGRSTRRRGQDVWEDLREELRGVKRAIHKRKLRRAAERDLRREAELEAN